MNEEPKPEDNKSKTLKELAEEYGITPKVFRPWLNKFKDKIGHRNGHSYTPKQIRIIHDHLGVPLLAFMMAALRWIIGDSGDDDDRGDHHHPNDHYQGRWRN